MLETKGELEVTKAIMNIVDIIRATKAFAFFAIFRTISRRRYAFFFFFFLKSTFKVNLQERNMIQRLSNKHLPSILRSFEIFIKLSFFSDSTDVYW